MTFLLLQHGLFGKTDIFGRDTMTVTDYLAPDPTRAFSKSPPTSPPAAAPKKRRALEGTSEERKTFPIASGVLDYFPDALAEVAMISYWGNQKHNPGEPLHHSRDKSADHADCMARHLVERGGFDVLMVNGKEIKLRHSAALAWRALAFLQEEVEREQNLDKPRGATALPRR